MVILFPKPAVTVNGSKDFAYKMAHSPGHRTDRTIIAMQNSKGVIRTVRLVNFTFIFITLTYSMRIFRDPGNNRYLTSLLRNPENSGPALRAAVGIFHMTAIGFEFFTLTFTFSFSLVFVCTVVDIMERLR